MIDIGGEAVFVFVASAVFGAVLVYTGTKLWQRNVLSRACLLVFFGGRAIAIWISQFVFSKVRVWATVSQLIRPLKRHSVTCPILERYCVWKKNTSCSVNLAKLHFVRDVLENWQLPYCHLLYSQLLKSQLLYVCYCWTKMCISNVFPTKLPEVIVDHIIRFNGLVVLVVSINIFVLFSYYYQQNQTFCSLFLSFECFLSRSSCWLVSNHLCSSEHSVDFFSSVLLSFHRLQFAVCSLHSNQFDFDYWKIFVEKLLIMPPQKTTVGIELHKSAASLDCVVMLYPYPSFQPTLPCCKLRLEKSDKADWLTLSFASLHAFPFGLAILVLVTNSNPFSFSTFEKCIYASVIFASAPGLIGCELSARERPNWVWRCIKKPLLSALPDLAPFGAGSTSQYGILCLHRFCEAFCGCLSAVVETDGWLLLPQFFATNAWGHHLGWL